jgi:hypothetical protein
MTTLELLDGIRTRWLLRRTHTLDLDWYYAASGWMARIIDWAPRPEQVIADSGGYHADLDDALSALLHSPRPGAAVLVDTRTS